MEFETLTYVILFATGFFAGFVDSIAGGGGIIALPVLLSVGAPPHLALGTNKMQSSFGSFTASVNYIRKGLVDFKETLRGILFTAIGALSGTIIIQLISPDLLAHIIPFLLVAIFLYTLLNPKVGASDKSHRLRPEVYYVIFGILLGFYDGFFGPGTGSFWTMSLVFFLGFNLKKATGYTKVFNFTSNVFSLGAFVIGGNVLFFVGLIMGIGQVIGATLGSHLVVAKGVSFVRTIFLIAVGATILKLIYSTYLS